MGYSPSRYANRNAFESSPSDPPLFVLPRNNLYNPVQVARPAFNGFISGNLADPNPANRTSLDSIFVSDTLGFAEDVVQLPVCMRHQMIQFSAYNINTNVQPRDYDERATNPRSEDAWVGEA